MRLHLFASLLLVAPKRRAVVNAFAPQLSSSSCRTTTTASIIHRHYMSEDDDWYADYDASKYNPQQRGGGDDDYYSNNDGYYQQQQPKRRSSGDGSRSSRRKQYSHAPGGSLYIRDTSVDNSAVVDEAVVTEMIEQRTEARRAHDFHTADDIRNTLRMEYGVSLDDKESTWCTGESPSSSSSGSSSSPFQRGGGGRGGRTTNYVRDTSRDESNVDLGTILNLMEQRTEARERCDYQAADAIREDLLANYHVGIDDREGTWRTGVSSSGSGRKHGGGGGNGRTSRERPTRGGGGGRKQRDFGPTGHDYDPSLDAGPNTSQYTEGEIHEMLAERLQAKMSRNFHLSDEIQRNLIDGGVFVHDVRKEWRADGVPFGSLHSDGRNPGRTEGSRRDRQTYTKSSHSEDLEEGVQDSLIEGLIAERATYKSTRDYETADKIRSGLKINFNVFIDDKLKQWSVGGYFDVDNSKSDSVTTFRNYVQSVSSQPLVLSEEDEEYVQQLVDKRLLCKRNHEFQTADDIRAELTETYDVTVHDKLRLWSVGGVFDESTLGRRGVVGGQKEQRVIVYNRRGGLGKLSDEDVTTIKDMLAERSLAKKERNYDIADAIRNDLTSKFNVAVDDRSNEWHVDDDEYVMVGDDENSNHLLSAKDVEYVESKLKERFCFKQEKLYDEADAIREDLATMFGVSICDRTKEWSVDAAMAVQGHDFVEDEKLDDTMDSVFDGPADDPIQVDNRFDNMTDDVKMSVEADLDAGVDSTTDELLKLEELSKLTVPLLKEKLKDAGLPVSGRKAELISRLVGTD